MLDRIELDLYFERLINLISEIPPDFDIDFSLDRSDAGVALYFSKNTISQVMKQCCACWVLQHLPSNSMLRELGKVFGLPKSWRSNRWSHLPVSKKFIPDQNTGKFDFWIQSSPPRHASQIWQFTMPVESWFHTSRFILYWQQKNASKGPSTCHIDMHVAEELACTSLIILSQRGLWNTSVCPFKQSSMRIKGVKSRYPTSRAVSKKTKDQSTPTGRA